LSLFSPCEKYFCIDSILREKEFDMADISTKVMIGELLNILDEAFEHPPMPWTYFTDNNAGAGFFGTLAKLSAVEASHSSGGTSIAAHVHHVVFSLAVSSAWMQGDRSSHDWQESWRISTVDDAAWSRLQEQLRSEYKNLRQVFASHASSSVEAFGGAIAAIAHAAYHLGAIRQKAVFNQRKED
jgi:hypothetical protein